MKTRIVMLVLIVIASLLQTTTIRAQATHPAYLSQMPTVARVKTEIKGSDTAETAARQMGAFLQLKKMIEDIAWGTERRYTNRLTPDEKRLSDEYYAAYGRIWVTTDQKFTALRDYDIDPRFRDELLVKFFSPEFRAAFYRAIRQQPTGLPQNAQPSATNNRPQPNASAGTEAEAYYEQGKKYLEAKEYTKAIEAYKKAIALQPVSAAYKDLGNAYSSLKQYSEAVAAYKQAVRLKPDNAVALFGLGLAYIELEQYENAVTALREALRLKPADADYNHQLGNAYFYLKRSPEAVVAYKQAIRLLPNYPEAYYGLGGTYLLLKQDENAVAAFREALRLKPDFAQASNQLGNIYFRLKQYPDALIAYQQAIRLKPDSVIYLLNLGYTYVEMGKKEDALRIYRALQTIDTAKAQELYGKINKPTTSQPTNEGGNPDGESAGSAGRRSRPARGAPPVRVAPGNPSGPRQPSASAGTGARAYVTEGDKYLEGKDNTKAIQAYKKAIALEPSLGAAYGGLALAYNDQGEYQLAISAWKQAQTLMRFEASDFILLGDAHKKLKQYDEALKEFRSAISLKPDSQLLSYAHYDIGYIYIKLKKYNDALVALRESVRIAPDYVHALNELGFAYMMTAQFPSAVAAYERVIRLKPDHAVARFHLGFTYVLMGKKEDALHVYRTLQRLDKKQAQELLADINKMK